MGFDEYCRKPKLALLFIDDLMTLNFPSVGSRINAPQYISQCPLSLWLIV
jgi:hypothetical protein